MIIKRAQRVLHAESEEETGFSKVEFLFMEKGFCVQCMLIVAYEDEPETVVLMDKYFKENGYENGFSEERMHHENDRDKIL